MAKKINVPQQTTTISEDVVYVDVAKLKTEVSNVATATKGINSSLKNMSALLKKAVSQKIVKGEKYRKIFTDASAHCTQQANGASNRLKGLQSKYEADVKTQEKNVLNGKIDELSQQVAKLQKQLDSTTATANKAANLGSNDIAANDFNNMVDTVKGAASTVADGVSGAATTVADAASDFAGKI